MENELFCCGFEINRGERKFGANLNKYANPEEVNSGKCCPFGLS